MFGVPFGGLGGLGSPVGSHWVAYENVKKTLVFTLFSAFGRSWRAPSGVVFSFFAISDRIYDRFLVSDRFFSFSDRIYVRFSVSDRFFVFFRFSRAMFSPRAYSRARFGSTRLATQRESAHLSGASGPGRAQSYLKGNTRY